MKDLLNSLVECFGVAGLTIIFIAYIGFILWAISLIKKSKKTDKLDLKEMELKSRASIQALSAFNRIKFICGSKEKHHQISKSRDTEFLADIKKDAVHKDYIIWAEVRILASRDSVWISILHKENITHEDDLLIQYFQKLCTDHYWFVTRGSSNHQPGDNELVCIFSWEKDTKDEMHPVSGENSW